LKGRKFQPFLFEDRGRIKGLLAPPAVFLGLQIFVFLLKRLHLSLHLLGLPFLLLTVVPGVGLAAVAIARRVEGRMRALEEVVQKVVLREVRERTVVIVGEVRTLLEPIERVLLLLRNELIAHL
jgi:hypothetical protein